MATTITLVSSAQTPRTMEALFQPLIAGILGFDQINDPNHAYSAARIGWQTEGQPAWEVSDNVCVITAVLEDDPYSRVRDDQYAMIGSPADALTSKMGFTQVWRMHFSFYGPLSADNARLVLSALSLDWTADVLQASKVYVVPEWHRPVYAPELYPDPGGVWYERTHLEVLFNEQVSESLTPVGAASTVEVTVDTDTGQTRTFQVGT